MSVNQLHNITCNLISSHVIDFLSAPIYLNIIVMAKRDFLENRNINEVNSLLDLVQNIFPYSEDEVNFTDHSLLL